jgi:hypothetical protein
MFSDFSWPKQRSSQHARVLIPAHNKRFVQFPETQEAVVLSSQKRRVQFPENISQKRTVHLILAEL